MRKRIFNISQFETNPKTGEQLITEEQIVNGLRHTAFTDWAYIRHDKDVYTEYDLRENPDVVVGEPKPPHWHIVIRCKNAVDSNKVAEWFAIPPQQIDLPVGKYAFRDCLVYLTHIDEKQQKAGKRVYDNSEVKTSFGLDYSAEVEAHILNHLKYGRDLSKVEQMYAEIAYEGLSIEDAKEKYGADFLINMDKAERYHQAYVKRWQKRAPYRINIYVEGNGGNGKNVICKLIARQILDPDSLLDDEAFVYETGSKKTTFEGYEGQSCIIWNDCRAENLLARLGDVGEVYKVFDPFPGKGAENVKYGSVVLRNTLNIINSVQPWKDFLEEIQGTEDAAQAARRFPMFLVLHEDDYELLLNKGVFNNTREYDQYMFISSLKGSAAKLIQSPKPEDPKLYEAKARELVAPVIEKYDRLTELFANEQRISNEEFLSRFGDVGTTDEDERQISIADYPKIRAEREAREREKKAQIERMETPRDDDIPFDDCPF